MENRSAKEFNILKAGGFVEPFSIIKLRNSLVKSGLSAKRCNDICDQIKNEISEGSNTGQIYKKAFKLVKESSPIATAHYSLKKSLFLLGPEGHHFEIYVEKYFQRLGYSTESRKIYQGKFIKHEIDVIGNLNGKFFFAECKFHNHSGIKNDVKVALYVKARWDDLKQGPFGKDLKSFYLVSNTSFTHDAIAYSKGTGLNLLGINMPFEDSFFDQIKRLKLFPITTLRRLPKSFRKILLNKEKVIAFELIKEGKLLKDIGMSENEINMLFEEIRILCGNEENLWN